MVIRLDDLITDAEVKEVVKVVAVQMMEEFGEFYYEEMEERLMNLEMTKKVLIEMQRVAFKKGFKND